MFRFIRMLAASRFAHYVLVAVLAFTVGGAAVASAVPAGHPIFSLADGIDITRLATVDAAGQVSTVDAVGNAKLGSIDTHLANVDAATGRLAFDGSGNLRVTQQGTVALSTTDFPDAGTHSRLDTTNAALTNANAKLDTTNARLASIDGATGKLHFDGSGNLQVTIVAQPATKDPDTVRTPFQQEVVVTIADGSSNLACCGVTIPAGKRLVIEFVSVRARLVNDQLVVAIIFTKAAGNFGIATDLLIHDNGDWNWIASQRVRLYADGPSSLSSPTLSFQAGRKGTTGAQNVVFDISGYLVDLP